MRKSWLVFIVVLALSVSACKIRYDTVVEIEDDRSGVLSFEFSADQELRDALAGFGGGGFDPLDAADTLLAQAPEGWSAEPFTEGAFEGVRTEAAFSNLAELNGLIGQLNEQAGLAGASTALFDFTASEADDQLIVEGQVADFLDEVTSQLGSLGAPIDPSLISSGFELRLLLSMPGEIVEHNGDLNLESGVIEWVFGADASSFRAVSTDASNTGALIGVGVLAAALVGGVLLWRMRGGGEPAPVGESMLAPEEDPYAE